MARVSIVRREIGTGICTGSFIQSNFLITIGRCLNHNVHLIERIEMLVGTVNHLQGGHRMLMAEFWWHPAPNQGWSRDLGLIRSTTNLPTGNPNIAPIRIASRAQTNWAFNGMNVSYKWLIAKKLDWSPQKGGNI